MPFSANENFPALLTRISSPDLLHHSMPAIGKLMLQKQKSPAF